MVILDIAMPGMDGLKVARQLRVAIPEGLTIICVSDYGTEADRERSRQAGCDHHFIKPADLDELSRLLA